MRKVWSKEFQNLPTASQQVKRLKEILAELGMDGRLSVEKAKAIKAKRDLAKELGESSFRSAVYPLKVALKRLTQQRMSDHLSKPLLGNPLATEPR